MKLYLVRHGEATNNPVDSERVLTKTGRQQIERLAAFLAPRQIHVQTIWHSDLPRALQTAELLAPAIKAGAGLLQHPGLRPFDKTRPLARALDDMTEDLLIAGHNPFLLKLASRLLTGKARRLVIDFGKGDAICLTHPVNGAWRLTWHIKQELLEKRGS